MNFIWFEHCLCELYWNLSKNNPTFPDNNVPFQSKNFLVAPENTKTALTLINHLMVSSLAQSHQTSSPQLLYQTSLFYNMYTTITLPQSPSIRLQHVLRYYVFTGSQFFEDLKKKLAVDFYRFCVMGFLIPTTTANDLRLRRIFYPRFYPLQLFSYRILNNSLPVLSLQVPLQLPRA